MWGSKLQSLQVKNACNQMVAQVVAWSLKITASGEWPTVGCFGENLDRHRQKLNSCSFASGWRAAFFGFKYDGKARKETNNFPRSYLHNYICESCLGQRQHKGWDKQLTYMNFYPQAPHRMTLICPPAKVCVPFLFESNHIKAWV